jgi:hypothetical protein
MEILSGFDQEILILLADIKIITCYLKESARKLGVDSSDHGIFDIFARSKTSCAYQEWQPGIRLNKGLL